MPTVTVTEAYRKWWSVNDVEIRKYENAHHACGRWHALVGDEEDDRDRRASSTTPIDTRGASSVPWHVRVVEMVKRVWLHESS